MATAASKSFSLPGLTSICAISVIIGFHLFCLDGRVYRSRRQRKRRRNGALPGRKCDALRPTAARCLQRPARSRQTARSANSCGLRVAPLGAALGDQRALIFVRSGEQTGEAAAGRGRSGFERHQGSLRVLSTDRFHDRNGRDRMVNSGLPQDRFVSGRRRLCVGPAGTPIRAALWRRQFSSDSGSSSAASTRLRPPRLAW